MVVVLHSTDKWPHLQQGYEAPLAPPHNTIIFHGGGLTTSALVCRTVHVPSLQKLPISITFQLEERESAAAGCVERRGENVVNFHIGNQ